MKARAAKKTGHQGFDMLMHDIRTEGTSRSEDGSQQQMLAITDGKATDTQDDSDTLPMPGGDFSGAVHDEYEVEMTGYTCACPDCKEKLGIDQSDDDTVANTPPMDPQSGGHKLAVTKVKAAQKKEKEAAKAAAKEAKDNAHVKKKPAMDNKRKKKHKMTRPQHGSHDQSKTNECKIVQRFTPGKKSAYIMYGSPVHYWVCCTETQSESYLEIIKQIKDFIENKNITSKEEAIAMRDNMLARMWGDLEAQEEFPDIC